MQVRLINRRLNVSSTGSGEKHCSRSMSHPQLFGERNALRFLKPSRLDRLVMESTSLTKTMCCTSDLVLTARNRMLAQCALAFSNEKPAVGANLTHGTVKTIANLHFYDGPNALAIGDFAK